jgi:outer membrane lipoprotein carrier protein
MLKHEGTGIVMTNRTKWFIGLVGLLAIGLVTNAQSAVAEKSAEEEVVERVQTRYESTLELEADFTQRATLKTLNETQVSSGKVYIRKPGNMRWDYLKPELQTILLKGDVLSVYTKEFNQLVEQPVTNLYRADTPTAFLAGQAKLEELFDVEVEPGSGEGQVVVWQLTLRPKKENPQLKELRLEVDKESYDINRSIIIDHFGNETDIRYINIQTNHGIAESVFALKLPSNVERVRPPSLPLK